MDHYPRKYFSVLIVQFHQYPGNIIVHIFSTEMFPLLVMNFHAEMFWY